MSGARLSDCEIRRSAAMGSSTTGGALCGYPDHEFEPQADAYENEALGATGATVDTATWDAYGKYDNPVGGTTWFGANDDGAGASTGGTTTPAPFKADNKSEMYREGSCVDIFEYETDNRMGKKVKCAVSF